MEVNDRDTFVIVRVIRARVGDSTYPSATEAAEARDKLAAAFPGREYSLAHVSFPLEGQVES